MTLIHSRKAITNVLLVFTTETLLQIILLVGWAKLFDKYSSRVNTIGLLKDTTEGLLMIKSLIFLPFYLLLQIFFVKNEIKRKNKIIYHVILYTIISAIFSVIFFVPIFYPSIIVALCFIASAGISALLYKPAFVPLPAVMGRPTAAPSGDEESPGNAEHLAS